MIDIGVVRRDELNLKDESGDDDADEKRSDIDSREHLRERLFVVTNKCQSLRVARTAEGLRTRRRS